MTLKSPPKSLAPKTFPGWESHFILSVKLPADLVTSLTLVPRRNLVRRNKSSEHNSRRSSVLLSSTLREAPAWSHSAGGLHLNCLLNFQPSLRTTLMLKDWLRLEFIILRQWRLRRLPRLTIIRGYLLTPISARIPNILSLTLWSLVLEV